MLQATTHGDITRILMAHTIRGRRLYEVSAYLIDGLLVDTGCPATAEELASWCLGQRIERAVNTHHHEDHCGGNALLASTFGLPLAASAKTAAILADFYRLPLYRRMVWGQPANSRADVLGDELVTDRLRFRVIPTPGHAPDHVCLFEPDRGLLLSGDLFISRHVHYLRAAEDAWIIIDSLRRVLALRPRLMVCSHAGLVDDACAAITDKIDYWEGLARDARRLRHQGLSVRRITRRLLGREGAMTFISGGDFSKSNLIRSLLREPERKPAVDVSRVSVPQAATGHFTTCE